MLLEGRRTRRNSSHGSDSYFISICVYDVRNQQDLLIVYNGRTTTAKNVNIHCIVSFSAEIYSVMTLERGIFLLVYERHSTGETQVIGTVESHNWVVQSRSDESLKPIFRFRGYFQLT